MLHIITSSPFAGGAFDSCLRFVRPNATIMLTGDAVYAALDGAAASTTLGQVMGERGLRVYVLEPDLCARGLGQRALLHGVLALDDTGFVDLTAACHPVHTWC